jgi:uncharacterized protein YyaL (SSP411 family)
LPRDAPARALSGLKDRFDRVDGGFGEAPKFPHAAELDFCLRAWKLHGDDEARPIVETTLRRMAAAASTIN